VLFLRARNPDRQYELHANELDFDWSVLAGIDVTVRGRWLVVNRGVTRALRGSQAVVVGGWNQPAFWSALAWCRMRRVPAILWSESTGLDLRSGRHERLKRAMLHIPAAFIVPGSGARDYLERLGVEAGRITVAPNAVDPAIFGSAPRTRTDGAVRLLAVGRLALEKGIDTLLQAADGLPVEVFLAGTGPEEERLRRMAGPSVRFLGNVPRDELPALYADADVLVLPSRSEPWGMTLNEAALAGLPLVSTTAAGAAWELIEDGVNGFRVPPDDAAALRIALQRLVDDETLRGAAGARSRELASRFTPHAWADAVTTAIDEITQ
jgi:glycosyltransferase involved in cell wall biosynthesis